jgi:hypothetical protein
VSVDEGCHVIHEATCSTASVDNRSLNVTLTALAISIISRVPLTVPMNVFVFRSNHATGDVTVIRDSTAAL